MKHGSKDDIYGAVVGAHRYFLYSNCYAAFVHEMSAIIVQHLLVYLYMTQSVVSK
jgi:hypothetical protein